MKTLFELERITRRLPNLFFHLWQTIDYSCTSWLVLCFEAALNLCVVIRLFVFSDGRKRKKAKFAHGYECHFSPPHESSHNPYIKSLRKTSRYLLLKHWL